MPQRHPARRFGELAAGILLIALAPFVAPLPGPAGTAFFAAGLLLVLRNSHRARVRYARVKRRWPRTGGFVDRAMRRGSALRRRRRDRGSALTSPSSPAMRPPVQAATVRPSSVSGHER